MAASRTTVRFAYDANGQRTSTTVVAGGTTSVVNDISQLGHLAYQTDATGATLATFTYDASNVPTSVTVGSGSAAPRSYYVSTGHGDVVNLTDASGTVVATYADAACGVLTSRSETLPTGWTNPYRYDDGRDGVRSDGETGRSWMAVRGCVCAPTTRAWAAASAAIRWAVPRSALRISRTPTWATTRWSTSIPAGSAAGCAMAATG